MQREPYILYDAVYSDAKHIGLLLTSATSTEEVGKLLYLCTVALDWYVHQLYMPPRCQSDALKACCCFCFLGMPALKQDPPGC